MKLITKEYHEQLITFDLDDDVMINLTEMAQANDVRLDKYMDNQQTKDYIKALEEAYPQKRGNDILMVKQGGINQGTWGCQELALHFAQWISPKFAVWCNIQVKELLTNATANRPSYMIDDQIERAKMWIVEEQERRTLIAVNNALMHVSKTYATSELAKELGFKSATILNTTLHNQGIQYKCNGTWMLYAKYTGLGLVETKQDFAKNGYLYYNLRWTQKGRAFVIALFADREVA